MVKARFSESQQPVKIIENGDMVTVFICLNGVEKTDENAFEESSTSYIEYDYNEFVEEKSLLNMDDLNSNPENYLNYIVNPELDKLKNEKIVESKTSLAEYLSSHPLFSKAKYEEGRYYTVTEEKQRQLTSKMAMYNIYSQQSLSYPLLKWNDVGNICEDWTVEELTKLAMEIDAYVTPLVEKQQAYEKMVQKVSNIEEFNMIGNLVFE
ncbi:hypothetical protein [Anaerobutyricum hallii]|uniref:hypothetical protein n=1 Tax=Anaerobutyricum hallii TaxID=39488 RepID=UPI00399C948F